MLIELQQAISLIEAGKTLHIAADEGLLAQLPAGNWIGGTTPYFIDAGGGVFTKDKLFVDEIAGVNFRIAVYDETSIARVAADAFDNGFTLLILPFGSRLLEAFAKDAANIDQIFLKNIAGWVSGYDLGDATARAKVFHGPSRTGHDAQGVALHVELPEDQLVTIGILNVFQADPDSPVIEFPSSAFTAGECIIDGRRMRFAEYLRSSGIDTRLPLVADYNGSNINISIKQVLEDTVELYAPVFAGTGYRFARAVDDYAATFASHVAAAPQPDAVFSCNCILNYLYGGLEGKKTSGFCGPITFGEIAYQLVNQTLVYVARM